MLIIFFYKARAKRNLLLVFGIGRPNWLGIPYLGLLLLSTLSMSCHVLVGATMCFHDNLRRSRRTTLKNSTVFFLLFKVVQAAP